MNRTVTKMFRVLFCMVVTLALTAGFTSVSATAASNGIYIATATPHYRHPVTGKIEDSGGDGSAVLGQSMTESATYRKALVEVDGKGNTFVTVRLKLMDNIQDPKFQVDGKVVSVEPMKENYTDNTADFRMKVNSEKSVIRCEMYVVPMGRSVIFYITVSGLQAGSGDFITSIKVEKPSSDPTPTETSNSSSQEQTTTTPEPSESEVTTAADPSQQTQTTTSAKSENNSSLGLMEFDESGNSVQNNTASETESGSGSVVWIGLGIVAAVLVAGGCVWYFGFFKKKK